MSTSILEAPNTVTASGSENCLPIGARVAEFEITGIVGEGGFGIVYLAFDHSLQRVVALKEYMPGVMAGRGSDQSVVVRSKRHQEAFDTGLRSFINEARLLAQFDHPALIKIHRFWEQNNTGYMAMRYYEGQTLKRIVQDEPGFVTEAWLKVMLQSILEALEALYRVQILHRDISPENIMIQKNGEAVLLDFGAARQIISDMTQALTVILKPGYAPIEQYADDPSMLQGPWTDIYSLSAVMYVAITNRTPPSSVARMIQDPIEPLAQGNYPGYSQAFLRAIDQGMAVKPEYRPRSIPEFRALLGLDAEPARAGDGARPAIDRTLPGRPSSRKAAADGNDASLTRHLPRTGASETNAVPLDASTRPMPPDSNPPAGGAQAASAAANGAAGTVATGGASNGAGASLAASAANALPAVPKKPRRSPLRTAALCAVIVVAGIVTWRSTHRTVEAPPPATPASAAAGEQIVDEETLAWETLRQRTDISPELVTRFIAQYPNGRLIDQARKRLDELRAVEASAAGAAGATAGGTAGAAAGAAPTAGATPATGLPAAAAVANGAGPATAAGSAAAVPGAAAAPTPAGTEAAAAPAEPAMVTVSLNIKPWGNVTIDGIDRGVSPPLKKLSLAEGKHAVRIVNPGFPEHVAEIEIGKKKANRINLDFAPAGK